MRSGSAARVDLVVTDRALVALAAHEATRIPGVVRLHASPAQAAAHAVRRAGTRRARRAGGSRRGVDVARDATATTFTIRITSSTRPPVLQVAESVQRDVAARIARLTRIDATVVVQVIDIEVG